MGSNPKSEGRVRLVLVLGFAKDIEYENEDEEEDDWHTWKFQTRSQRTFQRASYLIRSYPLACRISIGGFPTSRRHHFHQRNVSASGRMWLLLPGLMILIGTKATGWFAARKAIVISDSTSNRSVWRCILAHAPRGIRRKPHCVS